MHRAELSPPETSAVTSASCGWFLSPVMRQEVAAPLGNQERALCWEAPSSVWSCPL